MKKLIETLKMYYHAQTIPAGKDEAWDEICESNFSKFLDHLYWTLLTLIILYPTTALLVLAIQNYE